MCYNNISIPKRIFAEKIVPDISGTKKQEENLMPNINTDLYDLLSIFGYENKSDAYDTIRTSYSDMSGVTTYFADGMWYIVQSKALR